MKEVFVCEIMKEKDSAVDFILGRKEPKEICELQTQWLWVGGQCLQFLFITVNPNVPRVSDKPRPKTRPLCPITVRQPYIPQIKRHSCDPKNKHYFFEKKIYQFSKMKNHKCLSTLSYDKSINKLINNLFSIFWRSMINLVM